MESLSRISPEDSRRSFSDQLLVGELSSADRLEKSVSSSSTAANYSSNNNNTNLITVPGFREIVMGEAQPAGREVRDRDGSDVVVNQDVRPPPPTWATANAKDVKPPVVSESPVEPVEPDASKPGETNGTSETQNGTTTVPADTDAVSDIDDEILAGGDAEPEPPRYDGDFDVERHDYWWNLLDMNNPRHSRASKGMRYGAERNPRCETCERQNRACMTRPSSHDKTGCVRCSYTQSGCSHAREARESHQQKTGFPPKSSVGSARKRDDMEDEGSFSPPLESAAKRPRLSSYGGPLTGDIRGYNATPSRSAFDDPTTNGHHQSPYPAPGSVHERLATNGDGVRRHEPETRRPYYDSHEPLRREERNQQHDRCDRCETTSRDMHSVLGLVDKLQREVRVLRSRLDGMERRVDNISGAVDVYET